jgi:hypothetical protein
VNSKRNATCIGRFQHQERVIEVPDLRRMHQLSDFARFIGMVILGKIIVSGKDPERDAGQHECQRKRHYDS